jgi:hypothetical protein
LIKSILYEYIFIVLYEPVLYARILLRTLVTSHKAPNLVAGNKVASFMQY